ncbi:hypothetical protein ACFL08_04115 [Patescibacteria group bacterium]
MSVKILIVFLLVAVVVSLKYWDNTTSMDDHLETDRLKVSLIESFRQNQLNDSLDKVIVHVAESRPDVFSSERAMSLGFDLETAKDWPYCRKVAFINLLESEFAISYANYFGGLGEILATFEILSKAFIEFGTDKIDYEVAIKWIVFMMSEAMEIAEDPSQHLEIPKV